MLAKIETKKARHTNYSFTALYSATGADIEMTAFQKTPFSVIRSGDYYWRSGGLYDRGDAGYYWSSHTYASTAAHSLTFTASLFYPQNGADTPYGFPVRCVVR